MKNGLKREKGNPKPVFAETRVGPTDDDPLCAESAYISIATDRTLTSYIVPFHIEYSALDQTSNYRSPLVHTRF